MSTVGALGTASGGPDIVCDAEELRPHLGRTWLSGYVAARCGWGGSKRAAEVCPGTPFGIPVAASARHTLAIGATGTGKSRVKLHLEQEAVRGGCSVVVLDPKPQTLDALLHAARQAGVPPDRVTVLSPRGDTGDSRPPGWNPLDARATGIPVAQAAPDLVSVLRAGAGGSWGPRLQNLLMNALVAAGCYGLILYEARQILLRDGYRAALMLRPPLPLDASDRVAYAEAKAFFVDDFAGWPKGERASAVAAVTNKLAELLRNPYLRAFLCPRRNTLDLAALWRSQRLLLVLLDPVTLGDEGAGLLGGLLAHQLLRTARRGGEGGPGPVPVMLSVDELGIQERYIGAPLVDTLAIGRSQNLRLLLATQHLDGITAELRAAVLANAAVQMSFRVGYDDARLVAASLTAGEGDVTTRVEVGTVPGRRATWAHPLLDPSGRPLRLSAGSWERVRWQGMFDVPGAGRGTVETANALRGIARLTGTGRLYVRTADGGLPVEALKYVDGLVPGRDWWLDGPAPLSLVVSFPLPRVGKTERRTQADLAQHWIRVLMTLPVQHALVRVAPSGSEPVPPAVVRIADVAPPPVTGAGRRYAAEARDVNGQAMHEVAETDAWREMEIARITGGTVSRKGVPDDGSLA